MAKNNRDWSDFDPFPTHKPERKFDIWTSELNECEQLLERAKQRDPSVMQDERFQAYGGRRVDVQQRIAYIKKMLADPVMKFIAKRRERLAGV